MDFSQYGGPSQEWLAVEKTLPAMTYDINADPKELRAVVNGGREGASAAAMKILASKVKMQDFTIPTRDGSSIEARSYWPKDKPANETLPVYLYFHGGGFIFGTLSSEDATCSMTAVNAGVVVFNVNYRHSPEHTHPTSFYDTQDAFAYLHEHIADIGGDPEKVVVGGISAGGQLSASLALEQHLGIACQNLPKLAGQILMIPCVAHPDNYAEGPGKKLKSPEVSSYVENEHAPLLPKKTVEFFVKLMGSEPGELKDSKLSPVNFEADEVKGLPPAMFGIAGLDPLRDEALLYAKLLSEAGVPTETRLFKGVPHAFRRFGSALKASQDWDDCVEQGLHWCLSKPRATGKFDVKVFDADSSA